MTEFESFIDSTANIEMMKIGDIAATCAILMGW